MNEHLRNTAGGTMLTIIGIGWEDVAKTAILAALGAVVSFTVSVLLKWAKNKYFK